MITKRTVDRLLWRAVVAALSVVVAFLATDAQSASAADADGIAAGGFHNCALTTAGGLKCWGWSGFGELGAGTTASINDTPVDVVGLASGVAAVAAGKFHTCAVTTPADGLKCWGRNSDGQVGDGTTTNRSTPVDVVDLTSGVVAVSAGDFHTCAVTTPTDGLKCWGSNSGIAEQGIAGGQLGDGTTTDRTTPLDVSSLTSGVAAVSAGNISTCALTTAGGLKCWGAKFDGLLGDGTTTDRATPVDVVGLDGGVTAVSVGGFHACAVTSEGGLKCWGLGGNGRLGNGTPASHDTPADVLGFPDVVPEAVPVPSLSQWGLIALALALATSAYASTRRRRALRQTS